MMASAPDKGIQVVTPAEQSCRPAPPGTGTANSADAADQEAYS